MLNSKYFLYRKIAFIDSTFDKSKLDLYFTSEFKRKYGFSSYTFDEIPPHLSLNTFILGDAFGGGKLYLTTKSVQEVLKDAQNTYLLVFFPGVKYELSNITSTCKSLVFVGAILEEEKNKLEDVQERSKEEKKEDKVQTKEKMVELDQLELNKFSKIVLTGCNIFSNPHIEFKNLYMVYDEKSDPFKFKTDQPYVKTSGLIFNSNESGHTLNLKNIILVNHLKSVDTIQSNKYNLIANNSVIKGGKIYFENSQRFKVNQTTFIDLYLDIHQSNGLISNSFFFGKFTNWIYDSLISFINNLFDLSAINEEDQYRYLMKIDQGSDCTMTLCKLQGDYSDLFDLDRNSKLQVIGNLFLNWKKERKLCRVNWCSKLDIKANCFGTTEEKEVLVELNSGSIKGFNNVYHKDIFVEFSDYKSIILKKINK
jgi:hypothetical protein